MSHRAGNAIVFILGVTMIPCVQADVLNYARDWTQREEVNKSSVQSQEERRPAPREKSKTPPKASAKEGANKQVISSQADSLIKISRIWADFFPANTSNQPI